MLAGGYALWRGAGSDGEPRYRTEVAARGRLVVTVSATGSLQPTNKVDIGSELSGQVERVLVDDNDVVKQGQLLAQLDLSKLTDQAERSRSAATSAQARVRQAEATHLEARTTLERLREVRSLSGGKVPSEIEMAKAEATLSRAIADEAAARAAVEEAAAQVRSDETNLRKAAIRSPINGVVLARKVEPGQTVAASLQAPVLFTLAENLRQMELQVDVDEADVGRVRDGQPAVFTVDAYPGRRYPAKVTRVGYGSQVKDNVVTYPTLLTVDNEDLTLRPGMTATAEITAAIREDALLVPNAALRFNPAANASAPKEPSQSLVSKLIPRPPRSGSTPRKARDNSARVEQRVWVLREGEAAEIAITTGLSDGHHTEVTGGKLEAGAPVIVEAMAAKK
jgi:HlyD family secretion protein